MGTSKEHGIRCAETWSQKSLEQGPWDSRTDDTFSLEGACSEPMPVQITKSEEFMPFFAHLANGGTHENTTVRAGTKATESIERGHDVHMLEFERGVLYADGRMDLCKQVLGPPNLPALVDSLETNTFVRHFLFGNNIIGPHATKRIAQYIKRHPSQIETWYLAGNCINADALSSLVDAMVDSSSLTNVWLKRNPLGPESIKHIFRLITQTANLRTLDLVQCSLGDAGVAELFTLLASQDSQRLPPLRHLYLNACGAGSSAARALSAYLASPSCTLTSIYLSCNPIGSTSSIAALIDGLAANSSLERLVLQSIGLTSAGAVMLCKALSSHPTLHVLDIGNAYAADDLFARSNWIADGAVDAICNFTSDAPQLRYFDLGNTAISESGVDRVLQSIVSNHSRHLLHFNCVPTQHPDMGERQLSGGLRRRDARLKEALNTRLQENVWLAHGQDMGYERWAATQRRFLINPADVRYIDSVYRNRDVYKARKGFMILKKRWEVSERPLLEAVMRDTGNFEICEVA